MLTKNTPIWVQTLIGVTVSLWTAKNVTSWHLPFWESDSVRKSRNSGRLVTVTKWHGPTLNQERLMALSEMLLWIETLPHYLMATANPFLPSAPYFQCRAAEACNLMLWAWAFAWIVAPHQSSQFWYCVTWTWALLVVSPIFFLTPLVPTTHPVLGPSGLRGQMLPGHRLVLKALWSSWLSRQVLKVRHSRCPHQSPHEGVVTWIAVPMKVVFVFSHAKSDNFRCKTGWLLRSRSITGSPDIALVCERQEYRRVS